MIKSTKRLSKDTTYVRPKKTTQDTMSNDEIKEKLKGYKKVDDIKTVVIGNHLRYFTKTANSKKPVFRLGGFLNKFGENYKYIVLGNGQLSWSVQLNGSNEFWAKMSKKEYEQNIETEIQDQVEKRVQEQTENIGVSDDKYKDKYTTLKNQTEYILKLLEEQKQENEKLDKKLKSIEKVAKKEKKVKK